jgi:hypothetical protein
MSPDKKNLYYAFKSSFVANFVVLSLFKFALSAYAQPKDWGISEDEPANFKHLETVFANLVSIILSLVGLAVFVMLIKGGFTYLTSAGDQKKNTEASQTITWALIGLVVLLSLTFVFGLVHYFTGVNISEFRIPQYSPPINQNWRELPEHGN